MKLIIAIVNKDDSSAVSSALTQAGMTVTKLATTGGFLMTGNTTFLLGTEDERVEEALSIIEQHSKKRTHVVPSSAYGTAAYGAFPTEVTVGGATVFVTSVEQFKKF